MAEAIEVHQIYYKEAQKADIFPWAKPFFNPELTIFFENDVIMKIVSETEAEKVGVFSWKLKTKLVSMRIIPPCMPVDKAIFETEYDVLTTSRHSKAHQMMAMANAWHDGFTPAITCLWSKLGYTMPGEARIPIYQNHFVARADIYKRYVAEFLRPAMNLINSDEEMRDHAMKNSRYTDKLNMGDKKSVIEKLGIDYYPMAPFILERCPALWFQMLNIKVTTI